MGVGNETHGISNHVSKFTPSFLNASLAIQFLFCILILILIIKEVVQLVAELESPIDNQPQKKYEVPAVPMAASTEPNGNVNIDEHISSKYKPKNEPADRSPHRKAYIFCMKIERVVVRLPIFAICVINIILISTYEFLAIASYLCIIISLVKEFIPDKCTVPRFVLDIVVMAFLTGAYINAFVTINLNDFGIDL